MSLLDLDKVIENLMHSRHSKFPEDKDFFHYKDLGARKKLSTAHAIIDLIENTQKSLDDQKITGWIFIDLEKAFNVVDHMLLLKNFWSIKELVVLL